MPSTSLQRLARETLRVEVIWGSTGRVPGQRNYPWRALDGVKFWQNVEGSFELQLRDAKPVTIGPGEAMLVPPWVEMRQRGSSGGLKQRGADLRMSILGVIDLGTVYRYPATLSADVATRFYAALEPLLIPWHQAEAGLNLPGILQTAKAELNVLETFFSIAEPAGEFTQQHETVLRLAPALEHMHSRLGEKFVRADLARCAHMSESRFYVTFREVFGQSPQVYFDRLRIERARAELAGTNLPLKAIAEELGFADAFHLSRAFKRHTGMSPRVFRESLSMRTA